MAIVRTKLRARHKLINCPHCAGSASVAVSDVVVDSVVVERSRTGKVEGRITELMLGSAAVGGIASAFSQAL